MPDFIHDTLAFEASRPLIFTQFYFWAFFALVYAVFALVCNRSQMRNAFLCFVSLFFYYKASGLFVGLLVGVILTSHVLTWRMHKTDLAWLKRGLLITSVVIDLALLCYLKYAYFLTDVVNSITGLDLQVYNMFAAAGNAVAGQARWSVDQIILPVGISFFTFQVISYTVDVYRGRIKPVRRLLDYGFYVSFFPQLVAGPIVRATDFVPQLHRPFHLSKRQFGMALFWILNGLTKKLVLSDYIAVNFIDRVFDNPMLFTGFENLTALFGYSLQVYADFSGYTDIAIGVAMLMGFHLPKNFNSPYKAQNVSDFWRRWHISLSTWLRDYLYIPLGGNREATFGTYFALGLITLIVLILSGSVWGSGCVLGIIGVVMLMARANPNRTRHIITDLNVFATMLLGGLWHGASWNFMLWGGLNGAGIIVYKLWKRIGWGKRLGLITITALPFVGLSLLTGYGVSNIVAVWLVVVLAVSLVRAALVQMPWEISCGWLSNLWGIVQTFTFVTFTRLFFRAGSNLDPAMANETAWRTAQNMMLQIGGRWDVSIIPDIVRQYYATFLIIVIGLTIHWLPTTFKRWYRLSFALLPLPVMGIVVVLVVFVLYQFISADLQSFIYFQF